MQRIAPVVRTICGVLVRVLGEVDVLVDGAPVRIGSRSQRAVVAVLASRPGVAVPADVLIDALWGDDPPPSALGTLRTYVSRLRRLLGDRLAMGPAGYRLEPGPGGTDAERFEDLASQAGRAGPVEAIGLLGEALELWRGAPFGDLADLGPVRSEARRLEELHTAARESLARRLLDAGRAAGAVGASEQLVQEHPLREGAWVVLVESLARAGRVPEALRAFQRAAQVLAEAGLEPSERLRQAEAAALAREVPEAPEVGAHRLVVPASSLVGREADVPAVAGMLDRARIVTLVGPGGVGKTRLALAVADQVAGRFGRGARLVALAGVNDPTAVAGVVADSLGLAVEPGAPDRALAHAGGLDLLVVLDNCEHVADAAARAVEALTTGGARVRVLATSREPLGVDGEHLWPVAILETGTRRSASVELFLERARAVRPQLEPDDDELDHIENLTRRLDGLPLAIEMAAGRVGTLPVRELARRLEDELDLLVSRRRTPEPRHRTLAAVVEWSERLLDEPERAMFRDMAVFDGAVRAADVSAVTGRSDAADLLERLALRSLVVVDTSGSHARFGMLRTVRDLIRQKLAGTARGDELARRHAGHVAGAVAEADRELRAPGEAGAHDRIEELLDEARAAQAWASSFAPGLAEELCGALLLFGQSRRRDEVLSWSTALASRIGPDRSGVSVAQVLTAAAQRAVDGGDLDAALDLARKAVAATTDPAVQALAHEVASDVHLFSGRLDEAARAGAAGLAAARSAGDLHGQVANLINVALAASYRGDHVVAADTLAQAPERSSLAPSDQAWLLYAQGEVVMDRDPLRALESLDAAVTLGSSVGNRYVSGVAMVSATSLRARAGERRTALETFASVIDHWRGQGNLPYQLTTLRNLVVLLQRMGAAPQAAELLGAVGDGSVAPTFGEEAERLDRARAWLHDQMSRDELRRLTARGAARTVDQAAVAALEWIADLRS